MRRTLATVVPTTALALTAGLVCCGPAAADARSSSDGDRGTEDAGPSPADPAPTPAQPRRINAQVALDSARHGNDLAFDLFRATAEPGQNTVASPLSVRHALALAWAGAAGETDSAMRRVLRFPGDEGVEQAGLAGLVQSMLTTDERAAHAPEVSFASRIWLQGGFPLADGYEARVSAPHGTAFEQIDFAGGPDAARRTVNGWIEEQTRDRIQDLLPDGSVSADTRLILANAVYMNARWLVPFEREATWDAAFHVPEAGQVRVPTMHGKAFRRHAVTEAYKAVELDYQGSDLSMVLVMPTPGTLEAFEASLDAESWAAIVSSLATADVRLAMPRFEARAQSDLGGALKDMGMGVAFSDAADFSRMSSHEALLISGVFHGAFVRVDEAGTEAAAATAVVMAPTSAPIEDEPVVITIDHPFLFAIRDKATGAIIFLGRVTDPR